MSKKNSNFFLVNRSIFDSWIGENNDYFMIALRMISDANFTDGKKKTRQGLPLRRGQLVIGQDKFAALCNVPRQTLRSFMKQASRQGFLTSKHSKNGSTVTICNYNRYQSEFYEENVSNGNQQMSPIVTNLKQGLKTYNYSGNRPTHHTDQPTNQPTNVSNGNHIYNNYNNENNVCVGNTHNQRGFSQKATKKTTQTSKSDKERQKTPPTPQTFGMRKTKETSQSLEEIQRMVLDAYSQAYKKKFNNLPPTFADFEEAQRIAPLLWDACDHRKKLMRRVCFLYAGQTKDKYLERWGNPFEKIMSIVNKLKQDAIRQLTSEVSNGTYDENGF